MSKLHKTVLERKTARELNTVLEFASEAEERAFWETHGGFKYQAQHWINEQSQSDVVAV